MNEDLVDDTGGRNKEVLVDDTGGRNKEVLVDDDEDEDEDLDNDETQFIVKSGTSDSILDSKILLTSFTDSSSSSSFSCNVGVDISAQFIFFVILSSLFIRFVFFDTVFIADLTAPSLNLGNIHANPPSNTVLALSLLFCLPPSCVSKSVRYSISSPKTINDLSV